MSIQKVYIPTDKVVSADDWEKQRDAFIKHFNDVITTFGLDTDNSTNFSIIKGCEISFYYSNNITLNILKKQGTIDYITGFKINEGSIIFNGELYLLDDAFDVLDLDVYDSLKTVNLALVFSIEDEVTTNITVNSSSKLRTKKINPTLKIIPKSSVDNSKHYVLFYLDKITKSFTFNGNYNSRSPVTYKYWTIVDFETKFKKTISEKHKIDENIKKQIDNKFNDIVKINNIENILSSTSNDNFKGTVLNGLNIDNVRITYRPTYDINYKSGTSNKEVHDTQELCIMFKLKKGRLMFTDGKIGELQNDADINVILLNKSDMTTNKTFYLFYGGIGKNGRPNFHSSLSSSSNLTTIDNNKNVFTITSNNSSNINKRNYDQLAYLGKFIINSSYDIHINDNWNRDDIIVYNYRDSSNDRIHLFKEIEDNASDISSLNNYAQTSRQKITAVESDLTSFKSTVNSKHSTIEGKITANTNKVAALDSKLSSKISTLETKVTTNTQSISTNTSKISTANSEITTIKQTHSSDITSVKNSINSLKSQKATTVLAEYYRDLYPAGSYIDWYEGDPFPIAYSDVISNNIKVYIPIFRVYHEKDLFIRNYSGGSSAAVKMRMASNQYDSISSSGPNNAMSHPIFDESSSMHTTNANSAIFRKQWENYIERPLLDAHRFNLISSRDRSENIYTNNMTNNFNYNFMYDKSNTDDWNSYFTRYIPTISSSWNDVVKKYKNALYPIHVFKGNKSDTSHTLHLKSILNIPQGINVFNIVNEMSLYSSFYTRAVHNKDDFFKSYSGDRNKSRHLKTAFGPVYFFNLKVCGDWYNNPSNPNNLHYGDASKKNSTLCYNSFKEIQHFYSQWTNNYDSNWRNQTYESSEFYKYLDCVLGKRIPKNIFSENEFKELINYAPITKYDTELNPTKGGDYKWNCVLMPGWFDRFNSYNTIDNFYFEKDLNESINPSYILNQGVSYGLGTPQIHSIRKPIFRFVLARRFGRDFVNNSDVDQNSKNTDEKGDGLFHLPGF